MPGDPVAAMLGDGSYTSGEDEAALRALYGLDGPVILQFFSYGKRIAVLDFGLSVGRHLPVTDLVFSALGRTLAFALPALFAGAFSGIAFGAMAGWKAPSLAENLATAGSILSYAVPPYFMAILLLYIFSFKLGIFPLPGGPPDPGFTEALRRTALPVLTLSLFSFARNYLLIRGGVLSERTKPYPIFAFAKGLTSFQVLRRHVVKNAILPLVTLIALDLGFLVGGALFVEIVFSINGTGTLLYEALLGRDYPLIQGILFFLMLTVLTLNFLADLAYIRLDPRIGDSP
jgi:peptide/nickel transport system permease protein